MANDVTGQYLNTREESQISPYDLLMAEEKQKGEGQAFVEPVVDQSFTLDAPASAFDRLQSGQPLETPTKRPVKAVRGEADPGRSKVERVAADLDRGFIEAPRQILGGVRDATQETLEFADSAGTALQEWLGLENIPSNLQVFNEKGELDFDLLTNAQVEEKGGMRSLLDLPEVDAPDSVTGAMVRGVSQFLTGFIGAGKIKKVAGFEKAATKTGKVGEALVKGAVSDAIVFDPHEERLSDLIQEYPKLQNPVTAFLEAKEDDSEAFGRFKNAIEGLALGGITEAFVQTVRGVRAAKRAKRGDAEPIEPVKLPGEDPDAPDELESIFPQIGFPEDSMFTGGSGKSGTREELRTNFAAVRTADDVDQLIDGVADQNKKHITGENRAEVLESNTQKLADDLGISVNKFNSRNAENPYTAEEVIALRKIYHDSGETIVELAKDAVTGSDQDVAAFRRAMSTHSALRSHFMNLPLESKRSFESFDIQAKSTGEADDLITQSLESVGGTKFSKSMAAKVADLEDIRKVHKVVRGLQKARTRDMAFEVWINGLLSNPATHTVNVLSNSITAAWAVGERKVASMIGRALNNQSIPDGEVSAQLKGMVQGTKEGMKLAWNTLRTGEPSDPLIKIEMAGYKAITGENLNLTGTPGRFADFIGEVIRTPGGRLLTAEDEVFKGIGYRMELNTQAYRTAYNEGLRGDELAVRMQNIIDNPPENLHLSAVDFSRYQTFTKPLGDVGQSIQTVVQRIPGARIIAPFVRVPTNIMKYAGERTALAPLSTSVRAEINAGGARRDLALAKIATGSMIMAAVADYSLSGQVTGGGPKNPAMRGVLRTTGWQPYSIKVGDTYFSYNRLDPVGALIGLSADITEIMGQVDETEAMELAIASSITIGQNVVSKTYLRNVSEFFSVMGDLSAEVGDPNKEFGLWAERMIGSTVPAGVAQVEKIDDPALRATRGILEKIKSRIPGYSADLPPRRNIFGEPIVLSGGLGPDIMSPIYTSKDRKDPVADEIVAQQTLIRMPRNVVNGVHLNADMYDEYILLYSGKDNKLMQNVPLKKALVQVFKSSDYRKGTDGQDGLKSLLIRSTFETYRETAKAQLMLLHPELRMSIQKLQTDKVKKLTGK